MSSSPSGRLLRSLGAPGARARRTIGLRITSTRPHPPVFESSRRVEAHDEWEHLNHHRWPNPLGRDPVVGARYHRFAMSKIRPSRKASSFTESVIREMTRLANAHGAINLSQGFPD